jgi:hypothetical protein
MSAPADPPLTCGRCRLALVPSKVTVKYMGNDFPVELPRCPGCGKVYVSEALATGKMLKVEELLEDK